MKVVIFVTTLFQSYDNQEVSLLHDNVGRHNSHVNFLKKQNCNATTNNEINQNGNEISLNMKSCLNKN
jgi:hypothetical protein